MFWILEVVDKFNIKDKFKIVIKGLGKKPFVSNFIGFVAFVYTWLVGKTSKFDVQGMREFEKLVEEKDGGIFVTWHGRALLLPFFWNGKKTLKALVSPHQDGRIIARILRCFGILSIDGSTDRNARGAAVEIFRELKKGNVVALISDGPRGPSMRLNKSVIYFAQKTGKPVVGFTYSSHNSKVMRKSWDDMLIPRLFDKGYVKATKTLYVPKDISEDELEKIRLDFETELNNLTFEVDNACGLEPILPGGSKKIKRVVNDEKK